MTTATVRTAELRKQAASAEPAQRIQDAINAIFVAIGWLAGAAVTFVITALLAVRWGYRIGRGRDPQTGRRPGEPAPASQ